MSLLMDHAATVFLWGFVGTCAVACIQEGTMAFGLSRMSFPFLIGAFFTGDRRKAEAVGFLCYMAGGWLFALFYVCLFDSLKLSGAWVGGLIGLAQGIFMLLVVLPLLPYIHPRMITPYDGPTSARRIEPPGFLATNYGARAPLVHIIGQIAFGCIIGAAYQ